MLKELINKILDDIGLESISSGEQDYNQDEFNIIKSNQNTTDTE